MAKTLKKKTYRKKHTYRKKTKKQNKRKTHRKNGGEKRKAGELETGEGEPDGKREREMSEEEKNELQIHSIQVDDLYKDWFLDYASYVILERAVPNIEDGLKPVQRRILHAMKEMDDGRFHKVANVIGQTMQYHPHGDAAIGDALVNIGQKDLMLDTQGNWGDYRTGDNG